MKKIICIALSAAVVLSLASCGSNDSETPSDVNSTAVTKASATQTTQTTAATEYTYTDYTDYPEYGDDDYWYDEDYGNYDNYGYVGGYDDYNDYGGYDYRSYNDNNIGSEQAKTTKKKSSNSKAERLSISAQDIGYLFDNIELGILNNGSQFKNETEYTITSVEYRPDNSDIIYKYDKNIKPNATVNLSKTNSKKYTGYIRVKAKDSSGNEYELFNENSGLDVMKVKEKSGRKYTYWYNPNKSKIAFVYDESNNYSDLDVSEYGMKIVEFSPKQIDSIIQKCFSGIKLSSEKNSDGQYDNYISFKNSTDYRASYIALGFRYPDLHYENVKIEQNITPNKTSSNSAVKDYNGNNLSINDIEDVYFCFNDGENTEISVNGGTVYTYGVKGFYFCVDKPNEYWNYSYDYLTKEIIDIYYDK